MTDVSETLQTALNAIAARAPSHATPDGGFLVVVPDGYTTERVAPIEPPLPRIKQAVSLHDRDSFVSYVERYKSEATRLFAEPGFLANGSAHVVAVFDYHLPNAPDRCQHTATYTPRYSDQWKRWQSACVKPMAQAEFAEFIEEVRADIAEPEAAKLLDIVRTFKASKRVEFDSVTYQANGDVTLSYDEKTQQRGVSGALPEKMKLGIPVYFRGAVYAVPVFIRYRVATGAVHFQLKMDRADIIEDAAFNALTAEIKDTLAVDVYLGRR